MTPVADCEVRTVVLAVLPRNAISWTSRPPILQHFERVNFRSEAVLLRLARAVLEKLARNARGRTPNRNVLRVRVPASANTSSARDREGRFFRLEKCT